MADSLPLPYYLRAPGLPGPSADPNAPPAIPTGIAMPSSAPSMGLKMPVMPSINVQRPPAAPPSQTQLDINRYNDMSARGAGVDQLQNPFVHGIAKTADVVSQIAASVFAPARAVAMAIPGTELHHQVLLGRAQQQIAQDQAQDQATAQLADTNANTQHALAATRYTNDQARDAEAPPSPSYDYIDTPQGKMAILKGTTTAAPVTVNGSPIAPAVKEPTSEFELWHQQNPSGTAADFQNLQSKPISQQEADALNRVTDTLATKHGLPTGNFKAGMPHADAVQMQGAMMQAIGKQQGDTHITIQQAGQAQRAASLSTKNGALDLSNPESQMAVRSLANGDLALNEVLPRGASFAQRASLVAAAKAINPEFNSGDHNIENNVRRYMTSGGGATTIGAGNTLSHHLDLYDKAVDAVHNGDFKAVNAIGNELGVQTGSDAQTNLGLIRQGVAMEAARYYTGGVPGEKEIDGFEKNLSGDGSPSQMHNGASTVRAMARGKQDALQAQARAGSKGQAAFSSGAVGGVSVTAPDGSTHTFPNQGAADSFKKAAGIK